MLFSKIMISFPFIMTRFFFLFLVVVQGRVFIRTEYQTSPANMSYISAAPSPAPSPSHDIGEPPENNQRFIFDVTSFGAVGDGVTDDTPAFKMAWDSACQSTQPAILLVPPGLSFLVKPAFFNGPCRNHHVFQIDGTVMPPDGPASWEGYSKRQWLVFYKVDGMLMQGAGVIDGRGEKWWNLPCKPHKGVNGTTESSPCDSPVAIRFFNSSELTVKGLRIENSPQFHVRFDNCRDVHVESLIIKAPSSSPNTDGIHIENTKDVQIYNSAISNGDDCVSIGAGCYNVDIQNITCGPSHGISIGSLGVRNSRACVSNITVSNSIIKNSDNGVRIKTWQGGSGLVSQVSFSNIHMDNVRNPIIIDQYYCLTKNCTNQTSAVIISDILYTNIKGTYDVKSPPMHFACSDSIPCTNLKLADVELLPAKGQKLANPFCWNAYGTVQKDTVPPVSCLLEGFPLLITQDDAYYC